MTHIMIRKQFQKADHDLFQTPEELIEWASNVIVTHSSQLYELTSILARHCGPHNPSAPLFSATQIHVYNDDDDDMEPKADWESLRNAAFEFAVALLKKPLQDEMENAIMSRMKVATMLLVKRCSTEDMMDYDVDDTYDSMAYDDTDAFDQDSGDSQEYGDGDCGDDLKRMETAMATEALSGLALLPRAKRALCFQLLESTLQGIQSDFVTKQEQSPKITNNNNHNNHNNPPPESTTLQISTSTAQQVQKFASLCSSCLLGETDPRCLMQLLSLLHSTLVILSPILLLPPRLDKNHADANMTMMMHFPIMELFDAIAPYYPVRFTPPPNDVFGITRQGIHDALFRLFTYYSSTTTTPSLPLLAEPATLQQDRSIPPHNKPTAQTTTTTTNSILLESNMTVLATRLVLDRLAPPAALDPYGQDEDAHHAGTTNTEEDISVQDQLEAMHDLSTLLLGCSLHITTASSSTISSSSSSSSSTRDISPALHHLTPTVMTEVRTILTYCQNDAAAKSNPSTSYSSSTTTEAQEHYQTLTNACRTFATQLAHDLEVYQTRYSSSHHQHHLHGKSLYKIWVRDALTTFNSTIVSSPHSFQGRMATAHVASLAACGGIMTLRTCLDSILPTFITIVQKFSKTSKDTDPLVAALYGIGVIFSSCRLSMELIGKEGIHVSPHPLASFATPVLNSLCVILGDIHGAKREATMDDDEDVVTTTTTMESMSTFELLNVSCQVKIAAVKALESVLQCTPMSILNSADIQQVRTIVFLLSQVVISHEASEEENGSEWKRACTRIVGSTIGKALTLNTDEEQEQDSSMGTLDLDRVFFDSDDQVVSFAKETLFPNIVSSSLLPLSNEKLQRYDWVVLAYACEVGDYPVSETIVFNLIEALLESVHTSKNISITGSSLSIAKALSYVVKEGGIQSAIAFHKLQLKPATNVLNVLTLPLSKDNNDRPPLSNRPVLEPGMSTLLLPETMESFRVEIAGVVGDSMIY